MSIASLLIAATIAAASAGHAELLRVADTFDRAQLTKDRRAMERMVDDELVFIEGSGKRTGKREFIDGWMGPDDRYDPIVLVDRTLTPLGPDAFVVSAETTLTGTSGGKRFTSRFRFSDTFRRTGGRWRAVHIQVTRLPD
jgi:hypothetical protein